MNRVNGEIDRLLAERRPDRYQLGVDDDWMEDVAAQISRRIPEHELRRLAADRMVKQRETVKTKQANKLLRDVFESPEPPLGWLEQQALPIVAGKERVALRAATAEDLELFAANERRDAAAEFATRNRSCEAAEWMAQEMRRQGVTFAADLRLGEDAA